VHFGIHTGHRYGKTLLEPGIELERALDLFSGYAALGRLYITMSDAIPMQRFTANAQQKKGAAQAPTAVSYTDVFIWRCVRLFPYEDTQAKKC
jgi:hypothetical protein